MPATEEFRVVVDALLEAAPAGADLSAVEVKTMDDRRTVNIRTRTPGKFIGRRGSVCDAIRHAVSEELNDPDLRLNIIEERQSPDDPQPGPSSGDREPRSPQPDSPSTAAFLADREGT